jgi:hypothetical protein
MRSIVRNRHRAWIALSALFCASSGGTQHQLRMLWQHARNSSRRHDSHRTSNTASSSTKPARHATARSGKGTDCASDRGLRVNTTNISCASSESPRQVTVPALIRRTWRDFASSLLRKLAGSQTISRASVRICPLGRLRHHADLNQILTTAERGVECAKGANRRQLPQT